MVIQLAVNARGTMPQSGQLTIETTNVEFDGDYLQHHTVGPAGDYLLLEVTESEQGIPLMHLPHRSSGFVVGKSRSAELKKGEDMDRRRSRSCCGKVENVLYFPSFP